MFNNVTMSDLLIGLGNGKSRVKRWSDSRPKRKTKVVKNKDDKKK